MKRMEQLEVAYFATIRSQQDVSSRRSIDYSRKTPINSRRYETVQASESDFLVHRNGIDYKVEIFREADKDGRHHIVVKNK